MPGQLFYYVLNFAAAFAVALLSWNLYEKHFLKLKRFFPMHTRSAKPKPIHELELHTADLLSSEQAISAASV